MRMKTAVAAGLVMFCVACGWLILDTARADKDGRKGAIVPLAQTVTPEQATQAAPAPAQPAQEPAAPAAVTEAQPKQPVQTVEYPTLSAKNLPAETAHLGAVYPDVKRTSDPDKYKFMIFLTSQGAGVERVILNEFESRHHKVAQAEALSADAAGSSAKVVEPLTLLAPLGDQRKIYSLANTSLRVAPIEAEAFGTKAFPLDKLNWKLVETNNTDMARFEAVLFEEGQDPANATLRIVKTYRVEPGSYEMMTDLAVENLSGKPLKVQMQMQGPCGIQREDVRQDNRKVMAAYQDTQVSTRFITFADVQSTQAQITQPSQGVGTILKGIFGKKQTPAEKLRILPEKPAPFAWAAATNKYFGAIMRPVTQDSQESVWDFDMARYYGDIRDTGKESAGLVSFTLETEKPIMLAAAGENGAIQQFTLGTYLGPKDRSQFEANPVYKALGYFQTIDFNACCCPTWMIAPLAFGIIWIMKTMYTLMGPLGNYGVVIMVLVLVVRAILHPVTKKSQVSMMKMQKLGPKMQEIQKKYANNRAEMNKQVMLMYRENGATPIMGMLPMFLQMPIWIALWTAVYTSIDLRGAGFLPVWITDLSIPDQLFRIPYAETIQQVPLIGWVVPEYFNLLPILLGVVMYFQQKLMPQSAAAATNPQMAQQQKMMLWMMPLMFPLMLYNGPSGVNLYIMASIGGGVIEQKVIRKHIAERQEQEEQGKVPVTAKTGGKVKKKKAKPFFKLK